MKISMLDAGKRFNREWIFRHLNFQFIQGGQYALTGANGSGKSTLLQVIAGATMHSEGEIRYQTSDGLDISSDNAYKHISFASPYLDLIEEMTAMEFLKFHSKFKKFIAVPQLILQESGLSGAANKQIRYFSSGMKQRLKLAQAFFSDTTVLLLDEPTTNLDAEGIFLYRSLIEKYSSKRLLIISSNDEKEYDFCKEVIRIGDYK